MKKRLLSLTLVMALMFTMTGCSSDDKETAKDNAPTAKPTEATSEGGNTVTKAPTDPTSLGYLDINIGDYTDTTATIRFITHRTDLLQEENRDSLNLLTEYVEEFNKIYPNIKVEYEGITDYKETMEIRLTQKDWGDMCMIPASVDKADLGTYFEALGNYTTMAELYNFADEKSFDGVTYGLSSTGNAQGIVYNKAVFERAGITTLPKTPDEFLDALQKIKDTGAAVDPYYSNYKDDWAVGQWSAHIGGSTNGLAAYYNNMLSYTANPFSATEDMSGPYSVYYLIYNIAQRRLCEADPVTSDWEGCKARINNGEIGTMAMGSWAVPQFQAAGENPDDIGYMPFPVTIDGKQYASAGADYCYGINVNADDNTKLACMIYMKWLVEESGFSYNEGGIPTLKTGEYPPVLSAFAGCEFIVNDAPEAGHEDDFNNINTESEMGINVDGKKSQYVFWEGWKAGEGDTTAKTLDTIITEFNQAWTDAQAALGFDVKY